MTTMRDEQRIFRRQILNAFQLTLMVMRYRFLIDPHGPVTVFV